MDCSIEGKFFHGRHFQMSQVIFTSAKAVYSLFLCQMYVSVAVLGATSTYAGRLVNCCCPFHNIAFLASSIFLAASSCFQPPLLTHMALPSPNSTLSSTAGKGQGQ